MDVRASLNAESNLAVVTGDGEKSFVDNDSFYAMVPPQAASTVGRTKARRFMQETEMGSFLDDMPGRTVSPFEAQQVKGARPKVPVKTVVGNQAVERNGGDQPGHNIDCSSQDDRSSMGIINVDDMDLSTNSLLLETPLDELRRHDTIQESSSSSGSLVQKKNSSEGSTLKVNTPSDSFPWRHTGSTNSSQDSKPDQPFARSQITTVKKTMETPKSTAAPLSSAIRQSLFGHLTIGEEGEEKDTSVYQVELEAEELNEMDNDFGEIELSDDSEGDESKTPVQKELPKLTFAGDEIRIDSIYLRHGARSYDQTTTTSLPFLSKVSLFEGGSGSEIDTEDELEQARKDQGSRHEAVGEPSYSESSRPGLEGDCSDDHSGHRRLPITQRQSAEGDVVSSPVPGDGGGGGDGSSGSESEDGRRSRGTNSGGASSGYVSNLPSNRQSQTMDQEEQRIRPMGDDLLSEMRFSKYEASTNPDPDDTRLHSRYLARISPIEDTNPESIMIEDFLASHNQTGDEEEFSPGNRLEASGFNADDFSTHCNTGSNSNPFGHFEASFGSFGLSPGPSGAGQFPSPGQQMDLMPVETINNQRQNISEEKGNRSSGENAWTQLKGSTGTSFSSKQNSLGSEPRTSGDVGPHSHLYEQTDYARLGSEERGSLGRSSGSGSPSRSFAGQMMVGQSVGQSSSSGHSLNGSESNLRKSGSKSDLTDSAMFKKPFLPVPKAAGVFTKSVSKPKTYLSGSNHSSSNGGKGSGRSSNSSVRSEVNEFNNDLAFRLSLTNEAKEQTDGLKRVPSMGESNVMDLTVNDDDFFENNDALAMLDEDEKQFEEENIFRQDDAMVDTAASTDGWAYKSVTSLARPSWFDELSKEEKVVVRISVGAYIRSRTEALGSLGGDDESVQRPDFGMTVISPTKENVRPAALIEDEEVFGETRTSGVGEHTNGTQDRPVTPNNKHWKQPGSPKRIGSEDIVDSTMTMDSLLRTPKVDPYHADITSSNRPSQINDSLATGKSNVTSDISAFVHLDDFDIKSATAKLLSLHLKGSSSQSDGKKSATHNPAAPLKSSHLPVKKGSNLGQNEPKLVQSGPQFVQSGPKLVQSGPKLVQSEPKLVQSGSKGDQTESGPRLGQGGFTQMDHEHVKASMEYRQQSTDGVYDKLVSVNEQKRETVRDKSPENTGNHVSPLSSRSDLPEDIWSSPNTSNYVVRSSGLFDRLDEFQFSERFQSSEKLNLNRQQVQDLKDNLKAQYSLKGVQNRNLHSDREKTPPPDGEDRRSNQSSGMSRSHLNLQSKFNQQDPSKSGNESHVRNIGYDSHDRSVGNDSHYRSVGNDSHVRSGGNDSHVRRTLPSRDVKGLERTIQSIGERSDVSQKGVEMSRLNTSANDHGYMPGHHIPDGTAYSQRSDYSHMDHKGMSREDVAGVDDVGLAESRGFDMLNRKRDHVQKTVLGENRSQRIPREQSTGRYNDLDSYRIQPAQGLSYDPASRHSSMSQTGARMSVRSDRTTSEETQSRNESDRLESWTQTSLVFKQSVGVQPDTSLQPNINTQSQDSMNNEDTLEFQPVAPISFNMTDAMKSQFNQNLCDESEKSHLLTKKSSLIKTQFAQENLKRDYGVEVMDKIYSSKSIPGGENDADFHRLSIQSTTEWTELQHQKTFDMSQMSQSDMSNVGHNQLGQRWLSAHSTPMPSSDLDMYPTSQYSMANHLFPGDNITQISSGMDSQLFKTPVRASVCPVESPGILKFKDACCIGISKKEILPLKNPTDRWMECIIQVNSLEIDGQETSNDYFPFELRQKKIIIDPYKVENVDILFMPKKAGAYVAQVQIYSKAFTKSDDDLRKDSIPVNVTFQAIAEEPWIKVLCEDGQSDTLEFGEMVWGSCKEKTIGIQNMGDATVPLRLAITSTKGWHCFSFEPEGRMSDVSVISGRHVVQSGQGKTIINISLSGCNSSFNYHEVKVWCRPPDKQCTRVMARQPAEQFSCSIDVEVDIPCCKFPKLASLRLKVVVGIKKLHIQSKLKEIQLSASPNSCTETRLKLFNAGNLNLNVSLDFSEHKDIFAVTPRSLDISPGVESEINVSFKPTDYRTSRFMSLLLMMVLPQGPMFELRMQGDVVRKQVVPKIFCDYTTMDFGGVAIGKAVVKRYRLRNESEDSISMTAEVQVEDITLLLSPSPTAPDSKRMDLFLPPKEALSVYVKFTPLHPVSVSGKIVMRPLNFDTKYIVKVRGYGGVSKLCCSEDCTVSTSIQGYPCVNLENTSRITQLYIRNIGSQTALAKVALYKDLECSQRLYSGQIVVQPSEVSVEPQQKEILELVTGMSQSEFSAQCDSMGLGAVLKLTYKDKVESSKPNVSDLIIGIVKSKPVAEEFSGIFCTPSKSTRRLPPTVSQPLKDTTSFKTVDNIGTASSEGPEYGLWNVQPQELVLYCSRKGHSDQMRSFNIFNNNNTEMSFELSWPGDMFSLIPGRGFVKPREKTQVQIYPTTKASNQTEQFSGKVAVMANGTVKYMKVHLRQDSSGDENEPVQEENNRLVPVSTNLPQPGSTSNKLGNLEVSRTLVVFPKTAIGKTSEESLWLKNVGPDMLRWMFSSFATPYLNKTADKTKEMFRVAYKVFDFSRQFSTLNGQETLQITIQFMPRSCGTFSQYWNLQTTGNSGSSSSAHRQEYIRIHFTGEAFEEAERPSKMSSVIKDFPNIIPVEAKKLILREDKISFSSTRPGFCETQKVEFRNAYSEDVKVEVITPKPPFFAKRQKFSVSKRCYLRFPVDFRPSRPGKFTDTVKFQSSKGDDLILFLKGECS